MTNKLLKALEVVAYHPLEWSEATPAALDALYLARQLVKEMDELREELTRLQRDENVWAGEATKLREGNKRLRTVKGALERRQDKLKADAEGHRICEQNMDAEIERLKDEAAADKAHAYVVIRDLQTRLSAAEKRIKEFDEVVEAAKNHDSWRTASSEANLFCAVLRFKGGR